MAAPPSSGPGVKTLCCPHTQQRQRLVGTERSDSWQSLPISIPAPVASRVCCGTNYVQKEQRRGRDCSCRLWSWRSPAWDPRQNLSKVLEALLSFVIMSKVSKRIREDERRPAIILDPRP
jgi:hypothetical protein